MDGGNDFVRTPISFSWREKRPTGEMSLDLRSDGRNGSADGSGPDGVCSSSTVLLPGFRITIIIICSNPQATGHLLPMLSLIT
jgi:hypothetical protein